MGRGLNKGKSFLLVAAFVVHADFIQVHAFRFRSSLVKVTF